MTQVYEPRQYKFTRQLRVRWSEVDMQKVVFNANYLNYVEIVMTDFYKELDIYDHEKQAALGKELFARKATLELNSSAHFDDILDLCVRCTRIGNSSFDIEIAIFRNEELLVLGQMVYVYADMSIKKGTPIPEDWITKLKHYS